MMYNFYPFFFIPGLSALINIVLAFHIFKHRRTAKAKLILIILLLVILWCIAQILELSAAELRVKLIWANIYYIPVMLAPAVYLLLVLYHTGRESWYRSSLLRTVIFLVPLLMGILLWTDGTHGLIRQNVYLDTSGPMPVIAKTFGITFWYFAAYNFLVSGASLVLLLHALAHRGRKNRTQTLLLLSGLLLPFTTTTLNVFRLLPLKFDLTPAVFSISGTLITLGIFRYNLINVVPAAYSVIIKNMNTGIVIFDSKNRIADVNSCAARLLGKKTEELVDTQPEDALDNYPKLVDFYAVRSLQPQALEIFDKEYSRHYEVTLSQLRGKRKRSLGWLMMAYDITERKITEDKIRFIALHDTLTGLPNRAFFLELTAQQLLNAKRNRDGLGMGFIDLDNFKQVNDRFGHDFGDFVLKETAMRLKNTLRHSDIVARIGGDEYALVIPGISQTEGLNAVAKKIIEACRMPLQRDGSEVTIKLSVGLSLYPRDGETVEELLFTSDTAMYRAKRRGKNDFAVYDSSMMPG